MSHSLLKFVIAVSVLALSLNSLIAAEPKELSWFSLGGEVYQERDRFDAEKQVLSFDKQPRWFLGFPKAVSKDEFEAWLKNQAGKLQLEPSSEPSYQIPNPPPYAKRVVELPTAHHGSSLKFAIESEQEPGELVFILTLTAGNRSIRREIEHRNTNVVPFLFALQADGKVISEELDGTRKEGGTNKLIELVPAKTSQTWRFRVARKSLDSLVPETTQQLEITAAFSERQHEGYAGNDQSGSLEVWNLKNLPPQILVRSNLVRLQRSGDGWKNAE
ncbi:MAG: hypothetical protein WCJ09_01960 [Planctomycetota bacterium]